MSWDFEGGSPRGILKNNPPADRPNPKLKSLSSASFSSRGTRSASWLALALTDSGVSGGGLSSASFSPGLTSRDRSKSRSRGGSRSRSRSQDGGRPHTAEQIVAATLQSLGSESFVLKSEDKQPLQPLKSEIDWRLRFSDSDLEESFVSKYDEKMVVQSRTALFFAVAVLVMAALPDLPSLSSLPDQYLLWRSVLRTSCCIMMLVSLFSTLSLHRVSNLTLRSIDCRSLQ